MSTNLWKSIYDMTAVEGEVHWKVMDPIKYCRVAKDGAAFTLPCPRVISL